MSYLQKKINLGFWLLLLGLFREGHFASADAETHLTSDQMRVLEAAKAVLDNGHISYVYGGSRLGDSSQCAECNTCLEAKRPDPQARVVTCPDCRYCSLDCSHFVQQVFAMAGLNFPYLPTAIMLDLPAASLRKKYNLNIVQEGIGRALPGDLLVYRGHVVILEKLNPAGYGDIIHATSGKEVRGPGQGVQRARNVHLSSFRGQLLRVLRHSAIFSATSLVPTAPRPSKLRPMTKRQD